MSDSKWMTDLRRPCTPSRGRASAVLAHLPTGRLAPVLGARPRSGAPGHRIPRPHSESLISGVLELLGLEDLDRARVHLADVHPAGNGEGVEAPPQQPHAVFDVDAWR